MKKPLGFCGLKAPVGLMVLKDSQNIVDIFLPLLMQVKSFYNTVIKMPYGD